MTPGGLALVRRTLSASMQSTLDFDWRLRLAAFAHLSQLGGPDRVVRWADLVRGFEFEGEIVHMVAQSGIFRPRQLRDSGAALAIRTSPPDSRYGTPYDDQLNANDRFVHYRYRRGGADGSDNRSIRRAMELRRPLIWFYGLREGVYRAEFPVWVQSDLAGEESFELAIDSEASSPGLVLAGGSSVPLKEYATVVAKRRLHQARFRELVLSAYKQRCTVCQLGAKDSLMRMLDAAHIIPDSDEQGRPEVPNGLSLCKIHHAAYDLNVLGISPDLSVRIRQDILAEIDGPMLQHGIKEMEGRLIRVPSRAELSPNRDLLAIRFEQFVRAA